MEFLQGPSVSAYIRMIERNDVAGIQALKDTGFDALVFCNNIIANFLRDAFHHGAFHADLHPANLLILPNNVVGYVDFGIVAKLTPEARRKQIDLTLAYASGLSDSIHHEFLNICMVTDNADLEGMRRRIGEMARTWYAQPFVNGQVRFRVSVTKAMMDLLEVARTYGVLVDREMIKYIRSTILVDGLVTHLAPTFDIAGALRRAVENYMIEESQRKVLSPGGMLSFLTDVTVWMQNGPTSMVRALDQFERRQIVFRASVTEPPRRQDAAVLRIGATAAALLITVLFMVLTGGWNSWSSSSFSTYVGIGFVTSWSLWLLTSLWRQFRARPVPRSGS
jgi:ubiquinone biosynthesis protein